MRTAREEKRTAEVVIGEREARLAGCALAFGAEVGAVGDLGVGARCGKEIDMKGSETRGRAKQLHPINKRKPIEISRHAYRHQLPRTGCRPSG